MKPSIVLPQRRAWLLAAFVFLVGLLPTFAAGVLAAHSEDARIFDTHGQTGLVWSINSDPSVAPGLAAPQWQFAIRTDVPSLYYKSGTGNTAWTLLGSSSAGTGTVTSVACGANMSCSPSPITSAGTVATVSSPTFSGTVTGANLTATSAVTGATLHSTAGTLVGTSLSVGTTGNFGDAITFNSSGGQDIELVRTNGDPNGVVTAPKGSLAMDNSVSGPNLYQNSDGVTSWTLVGATGASAFYDTVLVKNFNAAGVGIVTFDDVNLGSLGQNTLVYTECNNLGFACSVTGFVGGVSGKVVTVCDDFNSTSVFGISLADASTSTSAPANQLWNNGGSQTGQHKGSCNSYWYGTWGGRTAWKQINSASN